MQIRSAVLTATIVLFSHAAWSDCRFSASRTADLDAGGVRNVIIQARAGDITVRGSTTASLVHASGRACATSQKDLDAIRIEIRRDGDTVHLETILPDDDSFMNRESLDLTIELPAAVKIQLDDSSGDLIVEKVAGARITDSSGDQTIRDIDGNVETTDSSGEIDIKNVRGNVKLSDSSGDVVVADITGDVMISVDSSGDLRLQRVSGTVHIKNDSSGDIVISDVNRDVVIDNDSSGSIRVADVGGGLTVAHDSSGGIDHRNVLGKVSIPREQDD